MNPSTRLRSPAEVVTAVPCLLGFHPTDSLVLLVLAPDTGALHCTVRLDLETPTHEILRVAHDLTARLETSRLLLLAYPPTLKDWIDSAAEDAVLDLDRQLDAAGLRLADALVVCEGRWWSMLCTDPDCCPIGGTAIPVGIPELEVDLIESGHLAPADSRAEVLLRYTAVPDPALTDELLDVAEDGLPTSLAERCDRSLSAIALLAAEGTAPDVRAGLVLLLQDVDVRDWVLVHLCTPDPDRSGVEALTQLALAAPEELRPRLAGAAAAALYAAAGTSVGVRALIDLAGSDSLARLVDLSLDNCLPPTVLQECFQTALPRLERRLTEQATA